MLTTPARELDSRAHAFAERCAAAGLHGTTAPGCSAIGGGAAPAAELRTTLVLLTPATITTADFERRLRLGRPAVIARIIDGAVALDLRTVPAAADDVLLECVLRAAMDSGAAS
jgi:L-seryl-tRNA(Ser) seleniumtransferase